MGRRGEEVYAHNVLGIPKKWSYYIHCLRNAHPLAFWMRRSVIAIQFHRVTCNTRVECWDLEWGDSSRRSPVIKCRWESIGRTWTRTASAKLIRAHFWITKITVCKEEPIIKCYEEGVCVNFAKVVCRGKEIWCSRCSKIENKSKHGQWSWKAVCLHSYTNKTLKDNIRLTVGTTRSQKQINEAKCNKSVCDHAPNKPNLENTGIDLLMCYRKASMKVASDTTKPRCCGWHEAEKPQEDRENVWLAEHPDSVAEKWLDNESHETSKHWSIEERYVNIAEVSNVPESRAEPVEGIRPCHACL